MAKCPGVTTIFRDRRAKCPRGCKKIVYQYWWARESAAERNDSSEICTQRWLNVYRRGTGPQPPAHINCGCRRRFAFFICIKRGTTPPVYSQKWDPVKKEFKP